MATPALRPIDRLTAEWTVTSRGPTSREALRRLADAEPEIAALGVADLGGVLAAMRDPHGAVARAHAARLLQAMLRSQPVHPMVTRAVLQAVLPGLVTVARRLSWGSGGDWPDGNAFFADVVATAWEVIVDWAGEDRDYAVLDLLSAVRCRVRRQLLGQKTARTRVALGVDDRLHAIPAGPATTDLEHLAHSIEELRANGLHPADAAVVYSHHVLGLSLTEISELTGRSRRQLDRHRRRAERALSA